MIEKAVPPAQLRIAALDYHGFAARLAPSACACRALAVTIKRNSLLGLSIVLDQRYKTRSNRDHILGSRGNRKRKAEIRNRNFSRSRAEARLQDDVPDTCNY
jgi:hypothetical protein